MTNRYFYQANIATFLAEDTNSIFGQMSLADEMDTASTQKFAWEHEITIMKNLLAPYSNEPAHIIFEYTIPRLGKRIDVVVLLRERVFVVEFKAGEEEFKHQDVDQVLDYALDLKNFHQGSADRWIIPILVATEETAFSTLCQPSHYDDGIYEPLLTNAAHLKDVFELVLSQPLEPIDVRCKPDTVHWFLDDINDVRSSLFLEDAASEFDVLGLELDWTCVV